MTYFDIYLTALSLIGEAENTSSTADYQKRAERLVSYVGISLYTLHRAIGGKEIAPEQFHIETLDALFILDERLSLTFSLELASLLILDKLPSVSASLKVRAEEEKVRVGTVGTLIAPIKEVYGI